MKPGDVVVSPTGGLRVIVDIAEYEDEPTICVLRYTDNDTRRKLDEQGGDIHLFSERMVDLRLADQ